MDCYYINLESDKNRRNSIETSFEKNKIDNWSLIRYPAIDKNHVYENNISGSLSLGEKGCFLSHKKLIHSRRNNPDSFFILEDDALFGKKSFKIIDKIIASLNKKNWDILFTDICIPDVGKMMNLIKMRRTLSEKGQMEIMNLKNLAPFAGATAYVLNGKSVKKLSDLLAIHKDLNTPYDLYLRNLICQSKITAYVSFPFVTSLSVDSELSSIQSSDTSSTALIWNMFRKMIWLERDFDQYATALEHINEHLCDEDSRSLAPILAAMVSKNFKSL